MASDQTLSYTLELVNNITPTVIRMKTAEKDLTITIEENKKSVDSQNISFLTQLAAVNALDMGLRRISGSLETLGLVGEQDAETLRKLSATVGLVVGSFNLIKGTVKIINTLRSAEVALAAVETYRSVLKNPAMVGAVALGLSAAGAAAGFAVGRAGQQSTTQVQQNISFTGGGISPQDRRSLTLDSLQTMGG